MTLACLQIPLHWLRAVPGGHEESSPSLGEPLLQHHLLQAGYPLLPPEVPAASYSWLVGTHWRDAFSALSGDMAGQEESPVRGKVVFFSPFNL